MRSLSASQPTSDLGDRETLLVAVVAGERRAGAVHAHDHPRASPATIAVAVDGYRRADSRRWYSETMLGTVVTSKAEHRAFANREVASRLDSPGCRP